jgi:hypothetical protein
MFAPVCQTEVDQGVRQMREALDAQNAAEVAEINQCLKKVSRSGRNSTTLHAFTVVRRLFSQLASGFPDPAAADSELQEKVRTRSQCSCV